MKVTSKETYNVMRAILNEKKFKQYQISKNENITFSLVNKITNWLVSRGYVSKRQGYYEIVSPAAIFNLFPIYRQIKPCEKFDVELSHKEAMRILKGRAVLCLTSALSFYDDYFRDTAIYAYVKDEKLLEDLRSLPKGLTHIEFFKEDLKLDDVAKKDGQLLTSMVRTVIDLFCNNRAYAAERLIKREWLDERNLRPKHN